MMRKAGENIIREVMSSQTTAKAGVSEPAEEESEGSAISLTTV